MSIANPSGRAPIVRHVRAFDARVTGAGWPWAEAHAAEIGRYWQEAVARNPRLFDGRVLIATRADVVDGVLVSDHAEIPFSALDYWRSLSFPDCGGFNLFGAAVVVSRDGAALLGRMSAGTANAGFVYFPAGTPDLSDVEHGRLDIEGSILRELVEETGLRADEISADEARVAVWDGGILCCARRFRVDLDASDLEKRVARHIAAERDAELDRAVLMHAPDDEAPGVVPAYVRAVLGAFLP